MIIKKRAATAVISNKGELTNHQEYLALFDVLSSSFDTMITTFQLHIHHNDLYLLLLMILSREPIHTNPGMMLAKACDSDCRYSVSVES